MRVKQMRLLAGLLVGGMAAAAVCGQSKQEPATPRGVPASVSSPTAESSSRSSFLLSRKSVPNQKAVKSYLLLWGIDDIVVRTTSSGALVRFSYRVVDVNKAQVLNEKRATPYLIDEKTQSALQIPDMEQVGKLRQTATPEVGHEYWMVFSNKRGFVKTGSWVDVVIGNVRINGLMVQ